jgi:hypothetical protein
MNFTVNNHENFQNKNSCMSNILIQGISTIFIDQISTYTFSKKKVNFMLA